GGVGGGGVAGGGGRKGVGGGGTAAAVGTRGPRSVPPEGRKPLAVRPTLGARAVKASLGRINDDAHWRSGHLAAHHDGRQLSQSTVVRRAWVRHAPQGRVHPRLHQQGGV